MSVVITSITIPNNSAYGTVVGVLRVLDDKGIIVPANFILTEKSSGIFSIDGSNLITVWNSSIYVGYYSVTVKAIGTINSLKEDAVFNVFVTNAVQVPPPAPPPPPTQSPPPSPPSPPTGVLSISVNTPVIAGSNMVVSVTNGPSTPGGKDWIGIYKPGMLVPNFLDWCYLSNTENYANPPVKNIMLVRAAPKIPGPYEVRFFLNDTAMLLYTASFNAV